MAAKKTVRDIDVTGKTALMRVDFNVPFMPDSTRILDDSRIRESLETIRYLLDRRCKTLLCSHLGRPNGKVVDGLRMGPVAERLSGLLERPVLQAPDCVGPQVASMVKDQPGDGVIILENLRFHAEEERNGLDFARELASPADLYVNDAFGAAHRAHASTVGVTRFLPAVSGLLMARELEMLGSALDSPRRPFAAVIGGAKVSDKIAVIRRLVQKVDTLIIGGGMAATFLEANGLDTGASRVDAEQVAVAGKLAAAARDAGVELLLPLDVIVAEEFSETAANRVAGVSAIPPAWRIMDIGPRTAALYSAALVKSKTVIWNGPMGVSEWRPFADGTAQIAHALAAMGDATTVLGGGSTAEAVSRLGLTGRMTHVSTGGGASLELLEGRTLPAVEALMDRV